MSLGIYKVDDGSTWYFDADCEQHARDLWISAQDEINGYKTEADVLEDFGEPEITRVQLVAAAEIKITTDERMDPCPHCNGTGKVTAFDSLLDVWRENNAKKPEERAHCGALANSEWP